MKEQEKDRGRERRMERDQGIGLVSEIRNFSPGAARFVQQGSLGVAQSIAWAHPHHLGFKSDEAYCSPRETDT